MQTKTSRTHPLKIDAMPCGGGLLGMTMCPGKKVNGRWDRDLALDMRAITDWGGSTVVSLMEAHEFLNLGVRDLGDVVEDAGLEWHCLPIRDVHPPDERFERLWTYSGHVIRRKLASGERIILHCRGGIGRTATIAARLLIECGVVPGDALRRVRAVDVNRVETSDQESYVLGQRAVVMEDSYYADRVLGCLLGGAIGDALGYRVEFLSLRAIRERFGPAGIQEPVLSPAGAAVVSDDTQMTLFTAEGLIEGFGGDGAFEQSDVLAAVRSSTLNWYAMQMGRRASGALCEYPVLGENRARGTTCESGCALGATGTPEKPINHSKGCGGVMRVAPVGLWLGLSDEEAFELAARCAAQTHGHPSGHLSAGAMASIVRNLVGGAGLVGCAERSIDMARNWPGADETISAIERACEMAGRDTTDRASAVARLGEGWVGEEALAIGLYSALVATDIADAVRIAANHGGDSDSTASIAGQIHGAWKGLAGIPRTWVRRLDVIDPLLEVVGRMVVADNPGV